MDIRTYVRAEGSIIKFEIILQGRIELGQPTVKDEICGGRTPAAIDMAAKNLLANADRWQDDSVFSRGILPWNQALRA